MKRNKTLRMSQMALLVAIILVMAYTPFGYLRTPGLEISFLMIPVAVGAMVLGPIEGAILGLVFGLTSFATCFGSSSFGVMLLSINPVSTFITCVVARILAGFLAGVIFKAMGSFKYSYEVGAIIAPVLNTLLFMGCIVLFFYNSEYIQSLASSLGASNPITFVVLFVGIQGLVEAIACGAVADVVSRNVHKFVK